jgi:nitroreductase/NAD-dependent dihydropyrimidine dehydrogenase PreA subunit
MRTAHMIDEATCTGDGVCVEACPAHIFELVERDGRAVAAPIAMRESSCMRCGHCMALCKPRSITVEGLDYDRDFFELPRSSVDAGVLGAFMANRRSVRVFKPRPVPRPVLEKIVEIVALAPMSFTPHKIELTVVSKRETIERALPAMVRMYEQLDRMLKNPAMRFIIRRHVSATGFASLDQHLRPTLGYRLAEMKAGKYDTITRGAPAMILFHSPRAAMGATEDAQIAVTYGQLAAQSLGLGASEIGLVTQAVNRSTEVRSIFGIPPGNIVHSAMILGYPKLRFRLGIRRPLAGVTWA